MKKSGKMLLSVLLITAMVFTGCSSSDKAVKSDSNKVTEQPDAGGTEDTSTQEESTTDAATASTDGPIVTDKVTYTIACKLSPNWGNPEDGEFWKQLEEETNIHIEWVTYLESEADEKFRLLMSSGDYPDAFIGTLGGNDADIITYGSQGIYIPLNDLISKYATNFNRRVSEEYPNVMKMITTPDGNIYAMPSVLYNPVIYNSTYINQKWLDAVGAKVPTTTDEFEAVLKQFATKDPNGNGQADEIPLSFIYSDWGASDAGGYFGAFGYPLSPDYTVIDQKKLVYLGAQDSFKSGAKWLASLYSQNLIDKDVFTQDESAYTAKIASGTVGVFSSWDASGAGDYAADYVALMPLTGPNGDANCLKEGITGFYKSCFMITNKAENPEILMQWVDRFYKDFETGLNATYGIGPDPNKAWNKDASGNIVMNETIPAEYVRGQQQLPFAPAILGTQAESVLAASGYGKAKADIVAQQLTYATKFTDGTWERWPVTFMTSDETEELSTLENDLTTYSKNQLAKWIACESDADADWDGYLKDLNDIGLNRWVELKQQIYDRYDSAK